MTFDELNTKLGGGESASDWRQAKGGGWIHKGAKVDDESKIGDNAIVWGRVYGDAQVFGNARVSGDAWKVSPLFIVGSKYSLTNCKRGHIQIGCMCQTFEWWQKNGEKEAEKQGFTKAEIEEYRAYIELFIKIGK